MNVSPKNTAVADAIIENVYTEEDRKWADLESRRAQADPSTDEAIDRRFSVDERVASEVAEYQRNAVKLVSGGQPASEAAQNSGDATTDLDTKLPLHRVVPWVRRA